MSLAAFATQTASVQRPQMGGNARTKQAHLSGLSCTPLYAADAGRRAELMHELQLDTLNALWEVFVLGVRDIRAGDYFITGGKEYLVRGAAPWSHDPLTPFTGLTVEEQITHE